MNITKYMHNHGRIQDFRIGGGGERNDQSKAYAVTSGKFEKLRAHKYNFLYSESLDV